MLNWSPRTDRKLLQHRASLLADIRGFFASRQVLEVDTPALSRAANTDPMLASVPAMLSEQQYFLHTSPEFPMKRLLAAGSGDIYQVCKVFRDGEAGRFHNPEFTLIEWYRLGMDYLSLAREVIELIRHVNNGEMELTVKTIRYSELFMLYLNIDLVSANRRQLQSAAEERIGDCPQDMDMDGYLDLLFSHVIAPVFDQQQLTIVYDYPASQAALARMNTDGRTAARFEIFWGELELANGFQELQDADEQRQRFIAENQRRRASGLTEMPVDEYLLAALEAGLPDCSGVALGLDRLLMRVSGASHIDEVLTFNSEQA